MNEVQSKPSVIWTQLLHVYGAISFAISQPIYNLLGAEPIFFVARGQQPIDLVALVVFLSIILPAIIFLPIYFLHKVQKKLSSIFLGIILYSLIALFALQISKILPIHNTLTIIFVSISISLIVVSAYFRLNLIKKIFTAFAIAGFVFPILYLTQEKNWSYIFDQRGYKEQPEISFAHTPPPIIFIVFDEFHLVSLLNEEKQIDQSLFPNFRRLADTSHWFRNATSVATGTQQSLTAILTGNRPTDFTTPPLAKYFPRSIFTLLDQKYDFEVWEAVGDFCPEDVCLKKRTMPFVSRVENMLLDLGAVYLHLIIPDKLVKRLPVVTQSWSNFNQKEVSFEANSKNKDSLYSQRLGQFNDFVSSISAVDQPKLNYIHINFPHVPYEHLQSGVRYQGGWNVPGMNYMTSVWENDEDRLVRGYQRFLLQAMAADKLLGDAFMKLDEQGLFHDALIVVTADHGVSFAQGRNRRHQPPLVNFDEAIMPVPLFIKEPKQSEGILSDRNVEIIDILPTIVDIIGLSTDWTFDGQSALDTKMPERNQKSIAYKGEDGDLVLYSTNSVNESKYKQLEWKLSYFGSNQGSKAIFNIGPYSKLIGSQVPDINRGKTSNFTYFAKNPNLFANIDQTSGFLPAHIEGQIVVHNTNQKEQDFAIAINDTIHATQLVKFDDDNSGTISVIIPEFAFINGKNSVKLYQIFEDQEGLITLHGERTSEGIKKESYILRMRSQEVFDVESSSGEYFSFSKDRFQGKVKTVEQSPGIIEISGWGADGKTKRAPYKYLVFENDNFVFSGNSYRTNSFFQKKGFIGPTIFRFLIPIEMFTHLNHSKLRVVLLSKDGFAGEISLEQSLVDALP
jgi:hypothetical protein